MASTSTNQDGSAQRDFRFFAEIVEAFQKADASAGDGGAGNIQVPAFLEAMTMFLRIFDAFSNPFFSDVVKKDVQGNITKLRDASAKHAAMTLEEVLDKENEDPKLKKLIAKESGAGANSGTVAVLWMKRMMQFILGLLDMLVKDKEITLAVASRKSYAKSLSLCHGFVTRKVFDTGLRFAPTRESFYANLAAGGEVAGVEAKMEEFLQVAQKMMGGIIAVYKERGLEKAIV